MSGFLNCEIREVFSLENFPLYNKFVRSRARLLIDLPPSSENFYNPVYTMEPL
jgi:hypothetical protein